MSLLRNTLALLDRQKKAGKSVADIHRALGGKIAREWFYKFAAGKIKNAGVNNVQSLHDRLKKIESRTP